MECMDGVFRFDFFVRKIGYFLVKCIEYNKSMNVREVMKLLNKALRKNG